MPYRCGLDDGRVKLSPSKNRRYDIVGAIEKQAITTCRRRGRCRTLTVHRFVISCDGAGVAWMRVAAAIRRLKDAPGWIDHGRLNLVMPADRSSKGKTPCIEPPTFGLGARGSGRSTAVDCVESTKQGAYEQVSLPPGFAPVNEIGARLALASADAPLSAADLRGPLPGLRRVSTSVGETLVAKVDPERLVEPIPGLEPYDPSYEPPAASDNWVTVVSAEPVHAAVSHARGARGPTAWAWLLTLMALATVVGLMRTRLAALAGRFGAMPGGWGMRREHSNGGAAVAALLEQTEATVANLKRASALREVLQSELRLVRQRLTKLEAAAAENDSSVGAARRATQLRGLVRELERIRRIADGAAASLSRTRHASNLPRTSAEAYDVLGVNPDVSADVLKRIVDALRMSWHPDHARGEDDRQERETRIRQINVAWELITAKHEAA